MWMCVWVRGRGSVTQSERGTVRKGDEMTGISFPKWGHSIPIYIWPTLCPTAPSSLPALNLHPPLQLEIIIVSKVKWGDLWPFRSIRMSENVAGIMSAVFHTHFLFVKKIMQIILKLNSVSMKQRIFWICDAYCFPCMELTASGLVPFIYQVIWNGDDHIKLKVWHEPKPKYFLSIPVFVLSLSRNAPASHPSTHPPLTSFPVCPRPH